MRSSSHLQPSFSSKQSSQKPDTETGAVKGPSMYAPALAQTLKEYLLRYRSEMDAHVRSASVTLEHSRAFARSFDGLLSALLPATEATLRQFSMWIPCSLAAVGSYGRGALAPRSDIDVRIVVDRESEESKAIADAVLYPLWDAGCSIGHQVIDVEGVLQLMREDLATATSVLDLRVVAGDKPRVEALCARAFEGYFAAELSSFLLALRKERADRHLRFGGSLYLLEPDVKSGAGGLRDLDVARWAARARFGIRELGDLVRLGMMVQREAAEIEAAELFLWRVRSHLHTKANRRCDRLTFETQEEIGRVFTVDPTLSDATVAEQLMQTYYGHARTVSRLVDRVLDLCDPPRARPRTVLQPNSLASGVRLFDGHVTLEQPTQLYNDPALALRLYHSAMKRDLSVYPYARDAVARSCSDAEFCEMLRNTSEAKSLFLDCLTHVAERTSAPGGLDGRGSILRELHDVGLLAALIPELEPLVGRVHHDTYHVYTVDVHSIAAVDRLHTMARGDLAADYPLACRLAGDLVRPVPLYVATLLHDVGKNGGGAGHSERGAILSQAICKRLLLNEADAAEVAWLIKEHLSMYHTATRRDLDDPTTIASLVDSLAKGTETASPSSRLQHLYLLTIADISTTSPTAMTTWKARMLDDLYLATHHHLATESRSEDARDLAFSKAVDAAILLWTDPSTLEFFRTYLLHMPKAYVLAYGAEALVSHAKLVHERSKDLCRIRSVPSRHLDAIELCVVAADRPGLLASIASVLSANRLDVMTAHIYGCELPAPFGAGKQAVDLFCVKRTCADDAEIDPLSERELQRLEDDLQRLLQDDEEPSQLLKKRRGGGARWSEKPIPKVPIGVEMDDRASRRFTVIDVYARDRPGLLYTIAHVLHELGLTIARSKIATEGSRAADSFYVTEVDGTKVSTLSRREEIKKGITDAIETLMREGISK